jgi:hypothetical protein
MKTSVGEIDLDRMPPDLLAQVQAAAEEEHRPTRDLVRDALEHYLESRRRVAPRTDAPEKALAVIAQLRELRKGNVLPEGVTIRGLIDEGRA